MKYFPFSHAGDQKTEKAQQDANLKGENLEEEVACIYLDLEPVSITSSQYEFHKKKPNTF